MAKKVKKAVKAAANAKKPPFKGGRGNLMQPAAMPAGKGVKKGY